MDLLPNVENPVEKAFWHNLFFLPEYRKIKRWIVQYISAQKSLFVTFYELFRIGLNKIVQFLVSLPHSF